MITNFINTAFQATVLTCAITYFFPNSKKIVKTYAVNIAKEVIKMCENDD